jgi:hypothetical protein
MLQSYQTFSIYSAATDTDRECAMDDLSSHFCSHDVSSADCHLGCNMTHNWQHLCQVQLSSSTWHCCGLQYLDYIMPFVFWSLYVILSIGFARTSGMWAELQCSVDQLHDINTQGSAYISYVFLCVCPH